jgi:hypothetical protein
LFQTICDGFEELLPIIINNKNETDETECEKWECDNIYTHCDGVWNCLNGKDEIGCDDLSRSMCFSNEHLCISILTYRFSCLNIDKVNDGNLDCVGGTDERIRRIYSMQASGLFNYGHLFYCLEGYPNVPILRYTLCDGQNNCKHGEDEKFCETDQTKFKQRGICRPNNIQYASNAEKFVCAFIEERYKRSIIHFTLKDMIHSVSKIISPIQISPEQHKSRCHRGLNLRMNEINLVCLCPPSYYGSNCEYQNERVSLAIRFRCFSDSWKTQFVIIILLIDDSNDRIIHSYEQINYLSLKNCRTKFQFYLVYSRRPKDLTKNYSIHIDFYEKKSLIHRGSLLIPILFPFLPVYRLSLIVDIPRTNNTKSQICSNRQCIHGKCIKYSNNLTFCQCDSGWSGKYCHMKYKCTCSSDSLCIGISAINHRSICVCPLNKFGPRCLLTIQINNNETICKNGGEYIPNDDDFISNEELTCICPEGYSGRRCEFIDNELSLSFDKKIYLFILLKL